MKFKLLIVALVSVLSSCSSDNSSSDNTAPATNYLPLETGNFWTYDIDGTNEMTRDSLYISNDTLISGNTYKKFKTKDQPIGFYSNSLNKNGVRKVGDQLLASGVVGLDFIQDFPININLSDFIIFKESASVNAVLGTTSGEFTQDVSGFPLKFQYTLKTTALETLPSFTSPNNDVYSDVKKIKLALNLKITTTVSFIPVTIMSSQDVVVSTQYYAKNIGVVHTNTVISYQLNNLPPQIELPIPSSGSQTQNEFLDVYQVN